MYDDEECSGSASTRSVVEPPDASFRLTAHGITVFPT